MRYQTFLDVSQSPDLEAFEKGLLQFGGELGFGMVSATLISELPDATTAIRTLHNAPPGYSEKLTADGDDSRRDPALRLVKRVNTPFFYDQSFYVDAGAADLWEEQAMYGFKTGIAVSLRTQGNTQFLLGFDRGEPLPTQDERRTRLLADLMLVAVHAQDAACRLLQPGKPSGSAPVLTKRELEILKWTAAGKTAWEVSRLLGISVHTVTYHMRRILAKLDASNKHKAVLNAMAQGIIQV